MKKALLFLCFALLGSAVGFAQQKAKVAKKHATDRTEISKNVPLPTKMKTAPFKGWLNTPAQAPKKAEGFCTVTLTAGDVWHDGSGYQMLLDADATAYTGGNPTINEAFYKEFEYFIPEEADCDLDTKHIIFESSETIKIPAGTYDFVILNPSPGDKIYVAGKSFTDNFVFEEGNEYEFTMVMGDDGHDKMTYTINGEEPPAPELVMYKRPEGSFFTIGEYGEGETMAYYYLQVPNDVPLTYYNFSTTPEETSWMVGQNKLGTQEEDKDEYVEDNNAVITYQPILGGYVNYLPTLNQGQVVYSCADGNYEGDESMIDLGSSGVYVPRELTTLSVNDIYRQGLYYGYGAPTATMPGHYGFGGIYPQSADYDKDGTPETYYPRAVYQKFEKPAAPLYLEQVYTIFYTDKINGEYKPIPDGEEIIMEFRNVEADGSMGSEVLGTFKCTSEDVVLRTNWEPQAEIGIGYAYFANVTLDEFDMETYEGVVLDQPFYILIDGLNKKGVDLGFQLNVFEEGSVELPFAEPTYQVYECEEGYMIANASYKAGEYCYRLPFYLYGIMENIAVVEELEVEDGVFQDGYNWLRFEETDGVAYTDIENKDYQIDAAILSPTMAWTTVEEQEDGDPITYENYYLVYNEGSGESYDCPSWLNVYVEEMDEEEYEGYTARTYLAFEKAPMRANGMKKVSVDGRSGAFCQIRVEGKTGMSDPIYVIDGDLTHEDVLKILEEGPTGINTVKTEKTVNNGNTYTLDGAIVNRSHRGIIIRNGKKMIQK